MSKVQTSLRLEEETFNEAKDILKSLGMNFTEAVNVFASMVVQERGLPFEVKVSDYPSVSFEEAQEKVIESIKNISNNNGVSFDDVLAKIIHKNKDR